jgi:AcrR family transcriptional regulator
MTKANAQASGAGTRELLLAATATAIARSGWSGVTTRQVASIAGVNQGLVHYHFGSMANLRRSTVMAVLTAEAEGPMDALLADQPLAAGIASCLDAVARIDPSSDRAAVLSEAMLNAGRDEELRAALAIAYDEFRAVLAARIRGAGGAEPEASATVLTAALDGLLLQRLVSPKLDLASLTGTLIAMLRMTPVAAR